MGMNVYEDLNYPDAESMFLKAGLMSQIQRAIRDRGIDIAAAAECIQIEPALLEDYLDGQFRELSTDVLVTYLNRLGQDVELVVTPKPAGQPQAKVTVRGALEKAA